MDRKYRDYFSIDEHYFPAVTEEVINSGEVDWKTFYPHDTFIRLMQDVEGVLSRKFRQSIWVEGEYGTGKSHAALTLKKLLDANDEETKAYFEMYNLSNDLFNKIKGAKSQGTILTVHRYGSANINNDRDLIVAIQESIKHSLQEKGIENKGESSLKDSVIRWLSDSVNKDFFNAKIERDYSALFEGDDVDVILEKLNTYSDKEIVNIINNIFKVADNEGITALKLDMNELIEWIKNIISANELKAIVFIWDEFTEYFQNNKHALTGFQQLVEVSATEPFYMVIVTHKSEGLFHDTDSDKKKILDRFVKPTCKIELPENMAFKLMGSAMKKKKDTQVLDEWNMYSDDLNSRLHDSRSLVMKQANITEEELKSILPIHPYTALLLKHLSTAFDSNQRSMFDFIKNNRGDEVKGFQWFIDNHGPEDDYEYILTIDMLWDFFYEKGKENLSSEIRTILNTFDTQNLEEMTEEEQKVLKTILLLQAISQKVGGTVELFLPNEKNISNAYDGTELEVGRAVSIAEKLVKEDILYKKATGLNRIQYSVRVNAGDTVAIEKYKKDFSESKKTQDLISEGELSSVLNLSGALKLRYKTRVATVDNFKRTVNEFRNVMDNNVNNIPVVITFAKNDDETVSLTKMIQNYCKDKENDFDIIFIDTSLTPLGKDGFEQYIEQVANSSFFRGNNNDQARQYDSMSQEVLKKWKDRITAGEFLIYRKKPEVQCQRIVSIDDLHFELKQINIEMYSKGIENFKVIENMFTSSSLAQGAKCGATQEASGTFRSGNTATKLETALDGAWQVENYWEKSPHLLISEIKIAIDNEIEAAFQKEGKISITQIYDMLKKSPYGFMPCNLTAFILGFLLKEYKDDKFRWSDGLNSDNMSAEKLKEMIKEVIDLQITPTNRYKEKFIKSLPEDEKAFSKATSKIFNIPENQCSSIEQIRDRLRAKMKELYFPIWCVKELLPTIELRTDNRVITQLITSYCGVANSSNIGTNKNELTIALDIGKECIKQPDVVDDLCKLVTKDNCKKGMQFYVNQFKEGRLTLLAQEIGDSNAAYMLSLKEKFDAADANWVWNTEEADKRIEEVILEYSIIAESNKYNTISKSYKESLQEWCEKIKLVRIPFDCIKNDIDDIKPFLELLFSLKKTGTLLPSQKNVFLSLLKIKFAGFKDFWETQSIWFKKVAAFYIEGLSDEDIAEIFKKIPGNVFIQDKSDYFKTVESTVEDYKTKLGKEKLHKFWKDKTGTDTPADWSNKYMMPILCMIKENEDTAKMVFDTVNSKNPTEVKVKIALEFLERATFYADLEKEDIRNSRFIKAIVKNYSPLLSDANEVKHHLYERLITEPYNWYQSAEVERKIKQFAEHRYMTGGNIVALRKIEEMDANRLKIYLKELIKENVIVGMEIINDK